MSAFQLKPLIQVWSLHTSTPSSSEKLSSLLYVRTRGHFKFFSSNKIVEHKVMLHAPCVNFFLQSSIASQHHARFENPGLWSGWDCVCLERYLCRTKEWSIYLVDTFESRCSWRCQSREVHAGHYWSSSPCLTSAENRMHAWDQMFCTYANRWRNFLHFGKSFVWFSVQVHSCSDRN